MHVDRPHGEVQLGGDLAVRPAGGDAADHLELTRRETGREARPGSPAELRQAAFGRRRQRPGAEPPRLQPCLFEPGPGLVVPAGRARGGRGTDQQLRAVVRQSTLK